MEYILTMVIIGMVAKTVTIVMIGIYVITIRDCGAV
jgi:hypothetical protein